MVVKNFYLLGKDPAKAENVHGVEIDITHDFDAAQSHVADAFSIVVPAGVGFQTQGSQTLPDLDALLDAEEPVAVTVDGHAIRKVPGPPGMPFVGNYYQVYPDHIGNNQRLFNRHGPVIQHTEMGKTSYLTNDPAVASVMFHESPFWSKLIQGAHPLLGAKDNRAGLFITDTNTESWRLAHKFLPPSLSPKAVRRYTPMTQHAAEQAFGVFDTFADQHEAFDVFEYMFKLTSQAVTKLILDIDLNHFESPDTPVGDFVSSVLELLTLIKKVNEHGAWYSHMPFGDPKKLHETQTRFFRYVSEAMKKAQAQGGPDLPIATAALEATSIADYAARAVDEDGNKLPPEVAAGSLPIVVAAGFTTTASLLSWMVNVMALHPEVQDRLVQELVDHGVDATTQWDFDTTNSLAYLDKVIKETQRLYNPAFQPTRTALRHQIIPGGFEIPQGAVMICSLHALHRNPAVWDDPNRFDPDRWDTDKVRNRPAGSFIPFATGPRSCIGFNFALIEAKTMFATLLYRYEFRKHGDDFLPDYNKDVAVYLPVNLYAEVRRRTSWPKPSASASAATAT